MPAPLSPKTRAQIVELAKQGHPAREIATLLSKRGMSAGKSAIADIAKQFHAGTLKGVAAPATPTTPTKANGSVRRAAPTTPTAPAPPANDGPPEELDATEVADLDLENLAKLARLFDSRMRKATKAGAVRLIPILLTSRMTVAREIQRLRPVVQPDPAKDPANAEARDLLRTRLEQLVESASTSDPGLQLLREHVRAAERAAEARRLADPATAEPTPTPAPAPPSEAAE